MRLRALAARGISEQGIGELRRVTEYARDREPLVRHRSPRKERGAADCRALADDALRTDRGRAAYLRVLLDDDVRAEDDRAVELSRVVDSTARLRPAARCDLLARDVDAHVAEHRVENRVAELVEVADVVPVGHRRVGVDLLVRRDETRPDVVAEVDEGVRGDALEELRLDHVDAAVGEIGARLVTRGFLLKAAHSRVAVEDDDAVRARVGDRLDGQSGERAGAPVMAQKSGYVDVVEAVARRDEDGLVPPEVLQLLRPARGTEQLRLMRPDD